MHPWVWGRMRLYGVQGTQSVRADDEPETRPIIGEEGSTLRLTTTDRRLKPPRTSPESQPRLGFTGASKKFCPSSFFFSKLKERGALYHSLNATEWTYESLPELIRLAKAAHTSRGRQFEARGGMLVTTGGQNRFYKDGVSIVDVAEGASISLMPGQSADSSLSQDNAPAPVGIDRAHLRRTRPRVMFPG